MKQLIRIDDNELFVELPSGMFVNKSMLEQFPASYRFQWSYEQLMRTGKFKDITNETLQKL